MVAVMHSGSPNTNRLMGGEGGEPGLQLIPTLFKNKHCRPGEFVIAIAHRSNAKQKQFLISSRPLLSITL